MKCLIVAILVVSNGCLPPPPAQDVTKETAAANQEPPPQTSPTKAMSVVSVLDPSRKRFSEDEANQINNELGFGAPWETAVAIVRNTLGKPNYITRSAQKEGAESQWWVSPKGPKSCYVLELAQHGDKLDFSRAFVFDEGSPLEAPKHGGGYFNPCTGESRQTR